MQVFAWVLVLRHAALHSELWLCTQRLLLVAARHCAPEDAHLCQG
jgi:hypothetical protein